VGTLLDDDLPGVTRLVLVRHGEGKVNVDGVIGGLSGCTGLTQLGRHQAKLLSERWATTGFRPYALVTSPVRRARETAHILAAGFDARFVEDCDLCELYLGEADGLSWQEYDARYGRFNLVAEPSRPFAPGAECWNDATARARGCMLELAQRFAGETVVVVTHAGFILASLLELLGMKYSTERASLDPGFASITIWRSTAAHWELQCFNDTAHLEGLHVASTDRLMS
jgi:probable phosphoglycerate mutase